MAQVEAEVQPDGVADDLGREAMATIQGRVDGHRPILPAYAGANLSTPDDWTWAVGGGHGIAVDAQHGVLSGGADPRRDGAAVAF